MSSYGENVKPKKEKKLCEDLMKMSSQCGAQPLKWKGDFCGGRMHSRRLLSHFSRMLRRQWLFLTGTPTPGWGLPSQLLSLHTLHTSDCCTCCCFTSKRSLAHVATGLTFQQFRVHIHACCYFYSCNFLQGFFFSNFFFLEHMVIFNRVRGSARNINEQRLEQIITETEPDSYRQIFLSWISTCKI